MSVRKLFSLKKFLIFGSFLAGIGSALVSCTVVETSVDDSKLYFAISFESNTAASKVLHQIAEAYNKEIESKKQEEGGLIPVRIIYYTNSYASTAERILNLLETKNINETPSLALNRPSLVSQVLSYNRGLELTKLDRNKVVELFNRIDTQIQGANPKKIWTAKVGFETNVNVVNGAMLDYILKDFQRVGAKIGQSLEVKNFINKIERMGQNDSETIKDRLGELTKEETTLKRIKEYVFDQRKFENLSDLLEFGDLIKKAYPKLQDFIIGIDDPAFLLYTLLFSQSGNNEKNMPMFVSNSSAEDENNQNFDYSGFFKENSQQYLNFKNLFSLLKPYIEKKVVWLPRNEDSYASVYFKEHQMLFNYSQTASYEFVFDDETEYLVTKENNKVSDSFFLFKNLEDNLKILRFLNPKKIKELKEKKKDQRVLGYYLKQENNLIGRVLAEEEGVTEILPEDLVVSKEFVKLVQEQISESQRRGKDKFVVLSQEGEPTSQRIRFSFQGQLEERDVFLSGETYLKNNPKTVQKSEWVALPGVKRVSRKTPHKAIYLEGPVLLGIKTSEVRDRNALRFIKWFTESKSWELSDSKTNKKEKILISPADYYALKSSYIPATKEGLLNPNPLYFEDVNDFFRVSMEEIRKIVRGKEQNTAFYKEPSAILASAIRYAIREALTNLIDPQYDFEKFIEGIKSTLN